VASLNYVILIDDYDADEPDGVHVLGELPDLPLRMNSRIAGIWL
jgi:hypothetical protein